MVVKMLLDKKREGKSLTREEIFELVNGYTRGDVPDYQMAAFAMAVCCKGMSDEETLALTEAMRDSGTCLTWEGYPPTADKHSTGGVGDKLSLLVQPIAAACGLAVPSLTGRGLGLTGGTADKMESVSGYKAGLTLERFRNVVKECGCSLAMQTPEIAPADKKLYALRDVTGTVPSIPLITASILSKKLAEGAQTLVFDVKCGCGAFMKTIKEARALANSLVRISKAAGRKAVALITDMNEPLGETIGNFNEVAEVVRIFRGEGGDRIMIDLAIEQAAYMVSLALDLPLDVARERCIEKFNNGEAFERFSKMVEMHGGDVNKIPGYLDSEMDCLHISSAETGFIKNIDAKAIAEIVLGLGGGRKVADDGIDKHAGVTLCCKHGDSVMAGQVLGIVSASRGPKCDRLLALAGVALSDVFHIIKKRAEPRKLILEVVQ